MNKVDLLISNNLFNRITYSLIDYLRTHEYMLNYLILFTLDDIPQYFELCDKLHYIEPKITINSLKLSYKIYQDIGKLFLPVYYRTYYGHWQKSSGACSGLIYWYDKNYPQTVKEYMTFERLQDMIKSNKRIIIQEPSIYNQFSAEVWTEDRE